MTDTNATTNNTQYLSTGVTDGNYLNTQYKYIRKLKKAIYGEVLLCFHYASNSQVAIKIITPRSVQYGRQMRAQGIQQKEDWITELEVMQRVQSVGGHPSVVRLLEDFEENGCVHIVMEFCDGGEMFDMCENISMQEPHCQDVFRKYMQGVLFLHSLDISHRDLSLENTLYMTSYGPKICDFGGSIRYDLTQTVDASLVVRDNEGRAEHVNRVGKQFYMSPQILAAKQYNPKCTDIWSSAIFLFLLLTGHPPWEWAHTGYDQSGAYQKYLQQGPAGFMQTVKDWKLFHCFSPGSWDLLVKMLHPEEHSRLTALECLNHPWLKKIPAKESNTIKRTTDDILLNTSRATLDMSKTSSEKNTASDTATKWSANAWFELNPTQQSQVRTLGLLASRLGPDHLKFRNALQMTMEESGYTAEQLQSLLNTPVSYEFTKGTKDGSERCIVM